MDSQDYKDAQGEALRIGRAMLDEHAQNYLTNLRTARIQEMTIEHFAENKAFQKAVLEHQEMAQQHQTVVQQHLAAQTATFAVIAFSLINLAKTDQHLPIDLELLTKQLALTPGVTSMVQMHRDHWEAIGHTFSKDKEPAPAANPEPLDVAGCGCGEAACEMPPLTPEEAETATFETVEELVQDLNAPEAEEQTAPLEPSSASAESSETKEVSPPATPTPEAETAGTAPSASPSEGVASKFEAEINAGLKQEETAKEKLKKASTEDVRQVLRALQMSQGKEAAVALLKRFDATNVSTLSEDKFQELIDAANQEL